MKKFNFTIIASGLNPRDDNFEDRFFESGCDDATISFQKGVIILEFTREAKGLAHAILSAIENVQSAGAKVQHIEPDYYVSLADIAKRTGFTRAALSQFANGQRGLDFPLPVLRVTSDNPLWDWVTVARWMYKKRKVPRRVVVEAQLVKEANLAINDSTGFERRPFTRQVRARIAKQEDLSCA